MLRVIYAESHKQAHYAVCHYSECHYAGCCGAVEPYLHWQNAISLSASASNSALCTFIS